jgi:hypothetical protein
MFDLSEFCQLRRQPLFITHEFNVAMAALTKRIALAESLIPVVVFTVLAISYARSTAGRRCTVSNQRLM